MCWIVRLESMAGISIFNRLGEALLLQLGMLVRGA